jgi:hypothetical protein
MRMRPPGTPSNTFAIPASEVCDELGVDAIAGLGEAEAARRLGLGIGVAGVDVAERIQYAVVKEC